MEKMDELTDYCEDSVTDIKSDRENKNILINGWICLLLILNQIEKKMNNELIVILFVLKLNQIY